MRNVLSANNSLKKFINHPSHHTEDRKGVGDNLLRNLGVESPEDIMSLIPSLLDGTIDEQGKEKLQNTLDVMQSHEDWTTMLGGTFPLRPIAIDYTTAPIEYLKKSALIEEYKKLGIIDNHGQVVFSRIIQLFSDRLNTGIKANTTREKIKYFVNNSRNDNDAFRGEDLDKLQSLDYSERVNENGITISNLGGIEFSSIETDETPYGTFTYSDLNKVFGDYRGKSFNLLNNNKTYQTLLTKSEAKPFESLEESNAFHFALMQKMADHLFKVGILTEQVAINLDFVDNPNNDTVIKLILQGLHVITGKKIVIPYKIGNDSGMVSSLVWINNDSCGRCHDFSVHLSFFI